jgi:hypothetical protein
MLIYNYDRDTHEYKGYNEARLDPEYKQPLCPGDATFIKPEQSKDGHVMVFKDDGWIEVVDHRGLVFNKNTKQYKNWESLGELPLLLTKQVPKEHDKWDEEKKEWIGHDEFLKQQFEYESSYEFKRMNEYPPILDQLDALYWDKINETNNWVESITKVKEKYPKPENKDV